MIVIIFIKKLSGIVGRARWTALRAFSIPDRSDQVEVITSLEVRNRWHV
ncbi:MAG: hypothetical protein ACE5H0_12100 [Bacteroidota bacterium]